MSKEAAVAVIGAGVVGCAVAYALARDGRPVTVFDRAEPGTGGASFGNVGHLAAELVQPLPSLQLLLSFWRELFAFGGPLDIPLRRVPAFAPWARRFAGAALQREAHTRYLAPLVRSTSNAFERLLCEIGRPELLRRHGHYQVWFGPDAAKRAERESHEMEQLRIPTQPVAAEILHAIAIAAGVPSAAALWFPEGGHIVDPLEVTRALMRAAVARGARFELDEVRALRPVGDLIEVALGSGRQLFSTAVVCAGAWSRPLLAAFGVHAPLEAAYGYHVELADQQPQVDAPLVYMDQKILVTPMSGRLRASGYMEFAGLDSEADPRKPARLRQKLRSLGYACAADGPSWRGPRPVLPDYLPGIGRAPGPHRLFYAVGHQHLGLTLAPVTAELMADMIAGRKPAMDVAEFDLKRFGVNPGSH